MNALSAALDLATHGFAVFPCVPKTKLPPWKGGFYKATTNPATVRRWWLACPDYNVAIRTGIASGVWVFDADGDAGATSLADLEAAHGPLPDTLISVTSNGCHFWFRYTCPIPCSADRVSRGLDVRGDGGYVLAPPSVHPDGAIYRWMNSRPLAVAPDWLIHLTRKPPPGPITSKIVSTQPGCTDAYGKAALEHEIAALARQIPASAGTTTKFGRHSREGGNPVLPHSRHAARAPESPPSRG